MPALFMCLPEAVDDWSQQAYLKASNTDRQDEFGRTLSLSADGNTLAVGAPSEDSNATGVNGDQGNNFPPDADPSPFFDPQQADAGAVYVFTRDELSWSQQAYIKANDTDLWAGFGISLSLSTDGDMLAIGTDWGSVAVYVFSRSGTNWHQQAYLKASNTDRQDEFGGAVSMSADGNSLAVGAYREAAVPRESMATK